MRSRGNCKYGHEVSECPHNVGCPVADCVGDSMRRSCSDAAISDAPVTDEPPHLADRRLAEFVEEIKELQLAAEFACDNPEDFENATEYWRGQNDILSVLLELYEENYAQPAAEAREE